MSGLSPADLLLAAAMYAAVLPHAWPPVHARHRTRRFGRAHLAVPTQGRRAHA